MGNAKGVGSTTRKRRNAIENMLLAIIDSPSDLASSDDMEDWND